MYRIESGENCAGGCDIVLEDDTVFRMPKEKLDQIVRDGARRCGYLSDGKKVSRIIYHDRQEIADGAVKRMKKCMRQETSGENAGRSPVF